MNQSKLESFIEACINTGSGIFIAMLVTEFLVVPLWDLQWDRVDNLKVTLIYTGIAIVRGYCWRRFFNAGIHKIVHRWVMG